MVGTSGIGTVNRLDQEITLLINSLSNQWTDGFWMMMSDKTIWIPLYIACVYFVFKRLGWKKGLVVLASVGIAFALCDQLSNIVKHAVLRLRPNYTASMLRDGLTLLEKRGGFYGFFSAHAANAFAIATCLTIGFRNDDTHTYNAFRTWSLVWAGLVSISRIFVGKHYFGDILVGAVVGLAVGYGTGMLARYIIRKYLAKAQG